MKNTVNTLLQVLACIFLCCFSIQAQETIFSEFPWISEIVDMDQCESTTIQVFQSGNSQFVYITEDGLGSLFGSEGQQYCQDAIGFSCLDFYGFSSLVGFWECDNSDRIEVEVCQDLSGISFGNCPQVLGYGVIDGSCIAIRGCNAIIGAIDYSTAIHQTVNVCLQTCETPCSLIDCVDDSTPVCGTDGINYDNACLAECAGVDVDHSGACDLPTCEAPDISTLEWLLSSLADPFFCDCDYQVRYSCREDIPILYVHPIEGVSTCDEAQGIYVSIDGNILCTEGGEAGDVCTGYEALNYNFGAPLWECNDCVCPEDLFAPVCGIDGITYNNPCEADCAGVAIANTGPCQTSPSDCVCPEELFAPVCGVDGITYNNPCEADCAGVAIANTGNCSATPNEGTSGGSPPFFMDYPWLSDIVDTEDCDVEEVSVYEEPIGTFIFVSSNGSGTLYSTEGVVWCTDYEGFSCVDYYSFFNVIFVWTCGQAGNQSSECECAQIYDPVCGVNGITYTNSCEAACAGIQIANTGECEINSGGGQGSSEDDRDDIFSEFEWLLDHIDFQNCDGIAITVYEESLGFFVYINDASGLGSLYFQDGNLYCRDFEGFSCLEYYNITNLTNTWTCNDCNCPAQSDVVCGVNGVSYNNPCEAVCAGIAVGYRGVCMQEPGFFNDYPWLSTYIDYTNCIGASITFMIHNNLMFLYINDGTDGWLFDSNGNLYCTDSPTFDCLSFYSFKQIIDRWECGQTTQRNFDDLQLELEHGKAKDDLLIYPMPVLDILNVEGLMVGNTLEVLNLSGQILKTIEVRQTNISIETTDLESGFYVLRSYNEKLESVKLQKFVKQ